MKTKNIANKKLHPLLLHMHSEKLAEWLQYKHFRLRFGRMLCKSGVRFLALTAEQQNTRTFDMFETIAGSSCKVETFY